MRKAFNAKAVQASSVDIIQKYYDPHVDGYLILGRVHDTQDFFVAWQSRHKATLVHGHNFSSETAAREFFDDISSEGIRPDHAIFREDWQQNHVYRWEQDFVGPRSKSLTKDEAKTLIQQICKDYKVSAPRLHWGEEETPDYYDPDDRKIYFGSHNNACLLHEVAHHIHSRLHEEDDEDLPGHAPGFVRYLIELYSRYGGIDLKYLQDSARDRNITGDKPGLHAPAANENEKPASRTSRSYPAGPPAHYAPGP
jgi:hypothetical protein